MTNLKIFNGKSRKNGGSISCNKNNTVIINKSFFSDLSSKGAGGVFYFYSNNIVSLEIISSKNTSSDSEGGGFSYFHDQNVIKILNSNFININTFNYYGGTFYFSDYNSIILENCSILNSVFKI